MIDVTDEPDDCDDHSRSIRTITLDRPEARNALTIEGLEALADAIESVSTDPEPDIDTDLDPEPGTGPETDADPETGFQTTEPVLYLRGRGDAFCAGADLETVAALDGDRDEAREFARLGQRVARAIETSPAIVVAGIDGAAMGGGLELALACDVRVGTPASTYGEPGVTFGLFGAWGGTVRLPQVLGQGDALEFVLSGRTVDAEEARRLGLISRIEAEPRTVAESIAENANDALTVLKRRIRDAADRETQERREVTAFGELVEHHADDIDAVLE